jgi:hypothetical protein
VIPETKEEKRLHETAPERAKIRKMRKQQSREWATFLTSDYPWN